MDISGWLALPISIGGLVIAWRSIRIARRADQRVEEVHEHKAVDWSIELDEQYLDEIRLRNTGFRDAHSVEYNLGYAVKVHSSGPRVWTIASGNSHAIRFVDEDEIMKLPDSIHVSWQLDRYDDSTRRDRYVSCAPAKAALRERQRESRKSEQGPET